MLYPTVTVIQSSSSSFFPFQKTRNKIFLLKTKLSSWSFWFLFLCSSYYIFILN